MRRDIAAARRELSSTGGTEVSPHSRELFQSRDCLLPEGLADEAAEVEELRGRVARQASELSSIRGVLARTASQEDDLKSTQAELESLRAEAEKYEALHMAEELESDGLRSSLQEYETLHLAREAEVEALRSELAALRTARRSSQRDLLVPGARPPDATTKPVAQPVEPFASSSASSFSASSKKSREELIC